MNGDGRKRIVPPVVAFVLTAALLVFLQTKVSRPMLLAERYWTGAGWAEIPFLAGWAAFLVDRMSDIRLAPAWRLRLWSLFSAVFFGQLALGLLGLERMLMTGKLHLPVPALIVAGPLYRGGGLFMPILFSATILLVGPAWCSHLCYIGAWDNLASRARRRHPLPALAWDGGGRRRWLRWANLGLAFAVPLLLRALGLPTTVAVACGAIFGLTGVAIMLLWSTRAGTMAHCSWYCPIGLLSSRLGRINPFRIRVATDRCTACGACSLACRYDALTRADVARGAPNRSCTLCGDCLAACRHDSMALAFPGLTPETSRRVFLVVVASLHAVFLGVARI
jgi:polyferredoxin